MIPETNKIYKGDTFEYVARIYGGGHLKKELVEKNGDVYKGHIKEYKVKGYGNTFCLTEDGRWFDNIGFECNVPSGFEHIKKVWEVKNEARKIREDKKYNEYKNKMFKKGAR